MSDDLIFMAEEQDAPAAAATPWIVMIVDDEPMLHESTRIAMADFTFGGHALEFISCYSAAEARQVLMARRDIALILLDVVMETDRAGLDLARSIREEIGNLNVRIVLRTGQPGQAPEEHVIKHYDINDYKAKTELTRNKLVTTFYASVRAYRDLMRLEQALNGLRRTIGAISQVYDSDNLIAFSSAVLSQANYLLNIHGEGVCAGRTAAYAASNDQEHLRVLAATPGFQRRHLDGETADLPAPVRLAIERAFREQRGYVDEHCFVGYHHAQHGTQSVLYMSFAERINSDVAELLQLFSANVVSTYETLLLREEVEETQRSTIFLLGEAMERRSKETGAHVRRVSEISALLGRASGMAPRDVEDIKQASPLHDVGKVAIPDRVLNKPGKLDADEWEIMKTHAELGYDILSKSPKRVLKLAAVIALQHHERWDGAGYPRGLAQDAIHIASRIVALADVFDALVSRRCYKDKWSPDDAFSYINSERGKHFDPALVDALCGRREELAEIYRLYPDHD
ncbi:HD domain-containing phosphohydrolase [Duganella sp. PWIR1]